MPDIDHTYGEDLSVSANGDLLVADSVDLSEQRILRRLLTNLQDYIWQPDYGAGLPQKVGDPFDVSTINAIIVGQMYLEDTVARNPSPQITVESFANGMFVSILYTEQDSGQDVTLGFPLTQQGLNG
jgi:hypothetical protein